MTQPPATLDQILARTRYLLLDFDGPICEFYPGDSARTVADQLRTHLQDQGVTLPEDIATTDSPVEVLTHAAISDDLAASTERELTTLEVTASASAIPTAYAADLLAACRESGRTVAIVSNSSTSAIHAYLERHNLVTHVVGRAGHNPNHLKPSPYLIEQAIEILNADPTTCIMLGDSPTDIESAHKTGVSSVGYANQPGKQQQLVSVGAETIITSLIDPVLHLRTRGVINP